MGCRKYEQQGMKSLTPEEIQKRWEEKPVSKQAEKRIKEMKRPIKC